MTRCRWFENSNEIIYVFEYYIDEIICFQQVVRNLKKCLSKTTIILNNEFSDNVTKMQIKNWIVYNDRLYRVIDSIVTRLKLKLLKFEKFIRYILNEKKNVSSYCDMNMNQIIKKNFNINKFKKVFFNAKDRSLLTRILMFFFDIIFQFFFSILKLFRFFVDFRIMYKWVRKNLFWCRKFFSIDTKFKNFIFIYVAFFLKSFLSILSFFFEIFFLILQWLFTDFVSL